VQSAIAYYQRALTLDPDFAAAHSAVARAQISVANHSKEPGRALLEQAKASALRAMELDPGISDAHLTLAEIRRTLEWNWRVAEDEYRTAIALSPSCETAHRFYAQFLAAMARFGEAKAEADRACDVDPFCLVVTTSAAWVRYAAGEFTTAIDRSRHVLDMDAGFGPARRLLGVALLAAGRADEAVVELTGAAGRGSDDPISLAWLAHAKAHAGAREEASAIVAKLEAELHSVYVPGYHLALAHAGLGNRDAAFALLEQACVDRESSVMNLKVEPRFEPLRHDARFSALIRRLHLPE